jgi:hypothetical protein
MITVTEIWQGWAACPAGKALQYPVQVPDLPTIVCALPLVLNHKQGGPLDGRCLQSLFLASPAFLICRGERPGLD